MSTRCVTGDFTGLAFPADPGALREGDIAFLTRAFRVSGVLDAGNSVVAIDRCEEVTGGSTGRKMLLDVTYRDPQPHLHRELFVKFSRDFDDPVRDRGRTQMAAEVTFATLSMSPGFPIAVPRTPFADYHRDTGTGILITERIMFGRNGIEDQHDKCLDYEMPRALDHYRALLTALARLAGAHRAGRLPGADRFPVDLQAASVGEPPVLTPEKLTRRLDRLAEFTQTRPGLLPANVRSTAFLGRLRAQAPQVVERQQAIWRELADTRDHIALCHWNANVDNAWFWTGDDGELCCGLMDWGCVSQMNVAMAIWGAMSGAETTLWDKHFDELLTLFCAEVGDAGGPHLDPAALARQVVLYAVLMGTTWLLDVPARLRAEAPDATHRTDPAIKQHEGVRAPLQMLANVLNLWESRDPGPALAMLGSSAPR